MREEIMRSLVLVCLVAAVGCGKGTPSGGSAPAVAADINSLPKGKYPAPAAKYQGSTAQEWGARALDLDEDTCRRAGRALRELGPEGVPFLLKAIEVNTKNGNALIEHLQGSLIQQSGDLVVLIPYLDGKHYGGWAALTVLKDAGPKAKYLAPNVRAMREKSASNKITEAKEKENVLRWYDTVLAEIDR